ncbi:MAG: phosphoglycerate kinase [Parachlamydiaceae bacterium]
MDKLSIKDLPLRGKKVLVRVDFNAPMDAQGHITDPSRILASLPTIQYLIDQKASIILMSHLGRPKGKVQSDLSLKPCAKYLSDRLKTPVLMASDCIGEGVEFLADNLKPGEILMLENLRFHEGEEKPKDHPEFVRSLARLAEYYINDAFGTAHRFHASTAAITEYFPEKAAAGFLLEKEIQFLGDALQHPGHPFFAIIGGAKISSKMGALKALLERVDTLLIGGAMAHTFLRAQGNEIGSSLYEEDQLEQARLLLEESRKKDKHLILPTDLLIANAVQENAETRVISLKEGIPQGWMGVDIGPQTIQTFIEQMQQAKTLFWNGPLGVFEIDPFSKGTEAVAKALAKCSSALTIVGGGDSLAAIHKAGVENQITHLSTGGGASLEYIEFGMLPGIEALSPRTNRAKITL